MTAANPKEETHCFIVRVDGELRAELEAHRARLSRGARKASLASAARHLLRVGLKHYQGRRASPAEQRELFQ